MTSDPSTPSRLYALLPAIVRRRDAEEGGPLQRLLRVIESEVGFLEDNIADLYNNWFIETCDDWVVPYLAELIDYPLPKFEQAHASRHQSRSPRREVAKAFSFRRRAGTPGLLEELAADLTGMPARLVEYDALLSATYDVRSGATAAATLNVRDAITISRRLGPFDAVPNLIDVRNLNSPRVRGRYGAEKIALFVWRTTVRRIEHATPRLVARVDGAFCYTFDPIGRDVPLYIRPSRRPGQRTSTTIEPTIGFPVPLQPHHFGNPTSHDNDLNALPEVYGSGRSVAISGGDGLIPLEKVRYIDLRHWPTDYTDERVSIDPILGRMIFSADPGSIEVMYHAAEPFQIGAGRWSSTRTLEMARRRRAQVETIIINSTQGAHRSLREFLARRDLQMVDAPESSPPELVIEITDSATYQLAENVTIRVAAGQRLTVRAEPGCRPVIVLPPVVDSHHPPMLHIEFEAGAEDHPRLILDGLFVHGLIHVKGEGDVVIRGCTLLPNGDKQVAPRSEMPSWTALWIDPPVRGIRIENSIVGRIVARHTPDAENEYFPTSASVDATHLNIQDSIIDAMPVKGPHAVRDEQEPDAYNRGYAIRAQLRPAALHLEMRRCTVLGQIDVPLLTIAENTLFDGPVQVQHRQQGGLRYCYVRPDSHRTATPRRYACQPETEMATHKDAKTFAPRFVSTICGRPGYAMLHPSCAQALLRGADDGGEIGALHDAQDFQRIERLRARLPRFVPARISSRIVLLSPGNEHELWSNQP